MLQFGRKLQVNYYWSACYFLKSEFDAQSDWECGASLRLSVLDPSSAKREIDVENLDTSEGVLNGAKVALVVGRMLRFRGALVQIVLAGNRQSGATRAERRASDRVANIVKEVQLMHR